MTDETLPIRAHVGAPRIPGYESPVWDRRWATSQPSRHQMLTCNYCGSLHPLDFLAAIKANPDLKAGWADWKYGWPHKLYVNGIPNELAGQTVECGSRSHRDEATGEIVREPIMDKAPADCFVKFYSEHMLDLAGRPEFDELASEIEARTGVLFSIRGDGELLFRARRAEEVKSDG